MDILGIRQSGITVSRPSLIDGLKPVKVPVAQSGLRPALSSLWLPPAIDRAKHLQSLDSYASPPLKSLDLAKRAAVGLLTRIHERRVNGKSAWRMADAPTDYMEQMLGGIVAFKIEVSRILAKSKLSQNRDERDYLGAISGLRSTGHEALAERMELRLSKSE